MLTPQRQQIILNLLKDQETVKINQLVEATGASEATIRRDLSQLEQKNRLKRIHGGASVLNQKREELSVSEKSTKNLHQKQAIAKYAASLVKDGDCIFLDAGSTTFQMIPYLKDKDIVVVTNGLTLLDSLSEYNLSTYLIGGYVKYKTRALIGRGAVQGLSQYQFDKCFLGANGVHASTGYTTPDPEEAMVKETALSLSQEAYVLCDATKINEVTFAKITDITEASLITDEKNEELMKPIKEQTSVKVVTT